MLLAAYVNFPLKLFQLTEDCLLINIDVPKTVNLYDPNNPPDERLPVLFWIHGGFFLFGSGTSYRTAAKVLSRDAQVIVVQVNYRLGEKKQEKTLVSVNLLYSLA